jgi:hypothetical protein
MCALIHGPLISEHALCRAPEAFMAEPFNPKSGSPDRVVRCFWHGPFSPYEALCLSSFVAAGITVELFSEAPVAGLPPGVTRRNAREILDQEVAVYRHEFDGPSPSLHSNHFRYALLEQIGGWWIDTDVMLMAASLPAAEVFVARQSDQELDGSVLRFSPGHPLIKAARERTAAVLGRYRTQAIDGVAACIRAAFVDRVAREHLCDRSG